MRVRLYEVGARSVGVLFIEEFPTCLALNEDGRIQTEINGCARICQLEDVGGQLYMRASDSPDLQVNNAPLEEGPLMPGDRLRYQGHDYLISYEKTQKAVPPPARYRISK